MLSVADKRWYSDEITLAIMRLNQHYGTQCPTPVIEWSLRGTHCLGKARGADMIILNAEYAEHFGRDRYRSTALHEACHIVTTWRRVFQFHLARPHKRPSNPWSAHGTEWQRAMRLLGLNPDRTVVVPQDVQAKMQPARKVGKVGAACNCQIHQITTIRYNKMLAGARYRCTACKSVLTPYRLVDGVVERIAS